MGLRCNTKTVTVHITVSCNIYDDIEGGLIENVLQNAIQSVTV